MRAPAFGLSSGSAPHLPAVELATLVRGSGGSVVDLRAGKRHRWEDEGPEPFSAAGLDISFIGISCVLGNRDQRPEDLAVLAAPWSGHRLKVFAAAGPAVDRQYVASQMAALTASGSGRTAGEVLLETHGGYAEVAEIAALVEDHGVGVVLDTRGLADIASDRVQPAVTLLAPAVSAVQCKAVAADGRHAPLGEEHRPQLVDLFERLVAADRVVDVLVESRAFRPGDLEFLASCHTAAGTSVRLPRVDRPLSVEPVP